MDISLTTIKVVILQYWNGIISAKSKSNAKKECHLFVENDFNRMTLDALGECVFGYEFNTTEAGDTIISRAFTDLFTGVNPAAKSFSIKLLLWFPFLKYFMKSVIKGEEALKTIACVIKQIIGDKREKKPDISTTRKDLLDRLIEAVDEETGQGMDEEELFSEVFAFLFAGHETSSVALSWILYYLAQYPDIQEKIRREVLETLTEQEGSWEAYESMEYLTAVINESMRLRPPVSVYRRKVIRDDNILGYNIPADSVIVISPYVVHRKPEYWSDPETFNPDRFLESNNPNNRRTFLPFSNGPRFCIGYRFALMEIKVVVATLIREFSFSMIPGMSFAGSISVTYRPKPNLELLVRKVSG
ncbi:cytochrome P450 4c21-like [Paramuricea clavata]|uniref:Cytochrome P450 4c21-like n=1 Tax=Paramuricea clavata TaxID=317549 RepID=A0A6S7H8I6_PARCT|nr:cytochrome P450 4c21-like [Paramuricea clavata]